MSKWARAAGSAPRSSSRSTFSTEPIQAAWWSSVPAGEPTTTPLNCGPTRSSTRSRFPLCAERTITSCASGSSVSGSGVVGRSPRAIEATAASAGSTSVEAPSRASSSCELVLPAQDGVLVRRPQRHVAAPGLAARPVDIGSVRDQELDRLRPSTTPDGVRDAEALVRVGAVLEQQPDVLQALVVEGVRECVRVGRLRTVLEQDPQTVRALRLGRVIDATRRRSGSRRPPAARASARGRA